MKTNKKLIRTVIITSFAFMTALSPLNVYGNTPIISTQVEAAQNLTIVYENGDKYVGEVQNGKRHGKGTMTYADGTQYYGSWKNDNKDGYGTEYYPDGTVYTGYFRNGKKTASG